MEWSDYEAKLKAKRKDLDLTQIKKAFLFATERHKDQMRKGNGAPYITHPIEVSLMLASYSEEIICAALLHDVVEDTPTPIEEIEQEFGSKIKSFVQGVTKPSKSEFPSKTERDQKAWEKFEKEAQNEPKVMLIKLADRVHNIRTIKALSPKRQVFKAKETLERYLPLAKQLDIGREFWVELEQKAQTILTQVEAQ